MSETIFMDVKKFKKFIKSMEEIGLKRRIYFANCKEGESEKRILREIKEKIENIIKKCSQ